MVERRFPVYVRPVFFVPGVVLALLGLFRGLDWTFDSQRFLGTAILRWSVRTPDFDGASAAWLLLALVGAAMTVASVGTWARALRGGLLGPTMRFYPVMAIFGLFLGVFGLLFLFDASTRGGPEAGATALYVTLDYARAMERGAQTIFGGMVVAAATLLLLFSFGFGAGKAARRKDARRSAAGGAVSARAQRQTI